MATNIKRGYTTIEIGDEEYILRYDFNALATADEELGGNCLGALANKPFSALRTMLRVGLANNRNPRGAVAQALGALDPSRLDYYMERIMAGLEAAGVIRSREEDGDTGEDKAPARGRKGEAATTGTNSDE